MENSSNSSKKQIFRDTFWKLFYFIMKMYVFAYALESSHRDN